MAVCHGDVDEAVLFAKVTGYCYCPYVVVRVMVLTVLSTDSL